MDILFFLILFTASRLHLNKKTLHKSRAYLAIPILIYNLFIFYSSKKKLTEPDLTQQKSTDLMLAMFLSDIILFLNKKIMDTSLYFHHIFCSLSYLISKYNNSPPIYTLMSIPEIMIFGKILKKKYKNLFYIFVIFCRYPFWYILYMNYKKFTISILSYNALIGSITMFLLDTHWLIEITKLLLKNK